MWRCMRGDNTLQENRQRKSSEKYHSELLPTWVNLPISPTVRKSCKVFRPRVNFQVAVFTHPPPTWVKIGG